MVRLYSCIDKYIAWKNFRSILSERLNFCMVDKLLIEGHAFPKCLVTSFSVDELLLPRFVKWFTKLRGLSFSVEITLSLLNANSV